MTSPNGYDIRLQGRDLDCRVLFQAAGVLDGLEGDTADAFLFEREVVQVKPGDLLAVGFLDLELEKAVAAANERNTRVNARVNATGQFLMSSTVLRGIYSLRICTHSYRTTAADVDALMDAVVEANGYADFRAALRR